MDKVAQSKDLLASLIEAIVTQAAETVIVTDTDLDSEDGPRILFANPAAISLSGYPAEELIGGRLSVFYTPDAMLDVMEQMHSAQEVGQPVMRELMTSNSKRQANWLEMSVTPIFDAAGKLQYFVRVARNITTRKAAEQSRESTQRLVASILGVIDDGLVVADQAGNLIMANAAVTRRLGWSIIEIIGKPVSMLIAPGDRARVEHMLSDKELADQRRQTAAHIQHRDGRALPGDIQISVIRQSDEREYRVMILQPKRAAAESAADATFKDIVQRAIKREGGNTAVVAGKLQLVNLETVRKSFGDRWEAVAARTFAIADRIIAKHMRPGDIFRRSTDDGYLVFFSGLTETEARFKAKTIGDEVREKLTGEIPELIEASVQTFAAAVSVDTTEAHTEESVVDALERRLQAERQRVEAASTKALDSGFKRDKASFLQVVGVAGQRAPIAFVAVPPSIREPLDVLQAMGQTPFTLQTEIFILTNAAEHMLAGLGGRRTELVVAPVHVETLTRHRDLEAWFKVARSIGEGARRQIVVEIRGLPADTAEGRIVDLVMKLSSQFRSIAVELPGTDLAMVKRLPSAVRIVSLPVQRIGLAGGMPPAAFGRLVKMLDLSQRRLIIKNAGEPAQIAALAKAGATLFLPEGG